MVSSILKISDSKSYELRFTAKRAEQLENELNTSLLKGLAQTERVGVLCKYIQYGAGITHDEALSAYDEFVENGGSMEQASEVVVDALLNGGYISKTAVDQVKKVREQLLHRAAQQG